MNSLAKSQHQEQEQHHHQQAAPQRVLMSSSSRSTLRELRDPEDEIESERSSYLFHLKLVKNICHTLPIFSFESQYMKSWGMWGSEVIMNSFQTRINSFQTRMYDEGRLEWNHSSLEWIHSNPLTPKPLGIGEIFFHILHAFLNFGQRHMPKKSSI